MSNNIEEVVQSTKKIWKTIFEEENKIEKYEEKEVHTIEESDIEIMVAIVIASLSFNLNQSIATSSVEKIEKEKKNSCIHPSSNQGTISDYL